MRTTTLFLLLLIIWSCTPIPKSIGDSSITVFQDTNLYFDMSLKEDSLKFSQDIIRLDAGRVLLKKVKLPTYELQPKVTIRTELTSNGDPWDKSGSLFVIPADAGWNLLDIEQGVLKKNQFQDSFPGIRSIKLEDKEYLPNVELMRFMTPFGIGHYNDDERVQALKPVYIPKWEDQVIWEQDITHLLDLLEGEIYIGVFIDTWTKQGYNITVNIEFEESMIPNHIKDNKGVMPLVNTTKYSAEQGYYDEFSRNNLRVELPLDSELNNAQLHYITTGHGGHEDGDEFTKKVNIITHNEDKILQIVPWRDDCASFRRFNPTSGVWTEKTTWKDQEIEERIASSDYSRSNWCPGSDVDPLVIDLGDLEAGIHQFEISIPEAQEIDGDKINYWMVSAYIVYDK